jgi:hypothetical protein
MYIFIYIYTLMYKYIGKLVPLHPCVPSPLVAVSWGT